MLRKTIFTFMISLLVLTLPQVWQGEYTLLREPVLPAWGSQAPAIEAVPAQKAANSPQLIHIPPPATSQRPEANASLDETLNDADKPAPSPDITFPDLRGHLSLVTAVAVIQTKPKDTGTSDTAPVTQAMDRIINSRQPMVALTFDDGPNSSVTTSILDTLKKHQASATFFVIGRLVPGNRSVVRRMIAEGHEIGNHTYDHKELTTISINECLRQIERTQQVVLDATGVAPRLIRPPYGSINKTVLGHLPLPVVTWSVDPRDWDKSRVNDIVKAALYNVRDGDIILLHDSKKLAAEATKIIVPELISRGYQLVTVSELFAARGIQLKPGSTVYRRAG